MTVRKKERPWKMSRRRICREPKKDNKIRAEKGIGHWSFFGREPIAEEKSGPPGRHGRLCGEANSTDWAQRRTALVGDFADAPAESEKGDTK